MQVLRVVHSKSKKKTDIVELHQQLQRILDGENKKAIECIESSFVCFMSYPRQLPPGDSEQYIIDLFLASSDKFKDALVRFAIATKNGMTPEIARQKIFHKKR